MKPRSAFVATAAAALVMASAAAAHVEVTPAKVPAGADVKLFFHVPAERTLPTVKLEVKLPSGLEELRVQSKPGWKSVVRGGIVTWSGGKIRPGKSDRFGLKARVPDKPGTVLLFPALQTYADGKVVHWIGDPTSAEPAPRVLLADTGTVTIGTVTFPSKGGHHRRPIALGIAVLAALLALGVALLWRRRA